MRYHLSMNRYTYRAKWSPEQCEYVGRCIELPWLSRWAPSMQQAMAAVEQAADEFIAAREEDGEDVPTPLNRTQIQRQIPGQDVAGAACAPRGRGRRTERVDESVGGAEAR
jgi:predicted RNase H-like HicB family nuclease